MSVINEYYAALARLKANKPTVLAKGSAINNDTVALEAGRIRLKRAVMLRLSRRLS